MNFELSPEQKMIRDTARDLPNWRRGADLARLVRVHAVPRGGGGGSRITITS